MRLEDVVHTTSVLLNGVPLSQVSFARARLRGAMPPREDAMPRFLAALAGLYLLVVAAVAAAFFARHEGYLLVSLPFLILAMGCCQYAIAQAAHEAWHFHMERRWIGGLLKVAVNFALGMPGRAAANHMAHHRFFGDPERDPDYAVYMRFPRDKLEFVLLIVGSITGLSAAMRFLSFFGMEKKARGGPAARPDPRHRFDLLRIVATQVIILAAFALAGAWYLYFLLWIAPLVIVKTLVDLRLLAEHGGLAEGPALRSFLGRGPMTRLLGAFGFSEHAEHHYFPQYHYASLPAIQTAIRACGAAEPTSGAAVVTLIHGGHLGLLWRSFLNMPLRRPKVVP